VGNYELFCLLQDIRVDYKIMQKLIRNSAYSRNALEFLAGLSDAEGCVKIIREEVRKTPKVCLDFTNTNKKLLDFAKGMLEETLRIKASFSLQHDESRGRKDCYHLRIYRKEWIKRFLKRVGTTKLTESKIPFVERWLARRRTR
jgi:intein-encoded DNA endonuclease-like protein